VLCEVVIPKLRNFVVTVPISCDGNCRQWVESVPANSASISSIDLFRDLKPEIRQDIATKLEVQSFAADAEIISAKQSSTDVYFILSGQVRVEQVSRDGKVVQFEDLASGMMFGELNAISPSERIGSCIALSDTHAAKMTADNFRKVYRTHTLVSEKIMQRLVELSRNHMQRVYELSTTTVSHRVRLELLRLARPFAEHGEPVEIQNAPTHTDIAQRIGTHREAVTRELKSLERQGLIRWNRKEHRILNHNALLTKV